MARKKRGGRLKLALFIFRRLVCDSGEAEIRCSDGRTVKVSTGCQASLVLMELENVAPDSQSRSFVSLVDGAART